MKNKGSRTERELLHMFHQSGCAVIRSAGSGVIPIPNPDLVAGKNGNLLAIECKSGKGTRYISGAQVFELKEFSEKLGAEPLVGVRFNNEEWHFLTLDKLDKRKTNGNNYSLDKKHAKEYGITFKELIKKLLKKK